jgi:hypothetical protein
MNKTSIATFDSHDRAMEAVVRLRENNFPIERVTIKGKTEITEEGITVRSNEQIIRTPVLIISFVGACLGFLSAIKAVAVPGFNFLYGSKWIIGILGGFGIGIAFGGSISLLLQLAYRKNYSLKYNERLSNGNFLLLVDGVDEEIAWARKIIGETYSGYDIREKIKVPDSSERVHKNI